MDPIVLIIMVLVVAVLVTPLAVASAFFLMRKSDQRHQLEVLDRFLSRNMSEYSMSDMVRKEVEIDQQQDQQGDQVDEDVLFEEFMASKTAREIAKDAVG